MTRLDNAIAFLRTLVAYPSVTDTPNADIMGFVADELRRYGARIDLVPLPNGKGVNLYASLGPDVEGGLVLSGHLDVVPVVGQSWTSDPFMLTERDGRLYGRGSCDMKGFTASLLATLPLLNVQKLKKPLHIALSADEELHAKGARAMIARFGRDTVKPSVCLVGEPTMMKVVTGQKGIAIFDMTVRGHEVHSSQVMEGVSAIMVAAKIIAFAENLMLENQQRALREGTGVPFEPPFTTLHCGQINGGTAHNITARDCKFVLDVRPVAGETIEHYETLLRTFIAETLEPAMKLISPECGIELKVLGGYPPMGPEVDGFAERLARSATGDNGTHVVAYGAEAGLFQDAGLSTIICGPGDIAQAHKPDEFIDIAQLDACNAYLEKIIAAWCSQ